MAQPIVVFWHCCGLCHQHIILGSMAGAAPSEPPCQPRRSGAGGAGSAGGEPEQAAAEALLGHLLDAWAECTPGQLGSQGAPDAGAAACCAAVLECARLLLDRLPPGQRPPRLPATSCGLVSRNCPLAGWGCVQGWCRLEAIHGLWPARQSRRTCNHGTACAQPVRLHCASGLKKTLQIVCVRW